MLRLPPDQGDPRVSPVSLAPVSLAPVSSGQTFKPPPLLRYQVYPTCRNTSGVLGFSVTVETQATKFR